jgi:hypothetical protein
MHQRAQKVSRKATLRRLASTLSLSIYVQLHTPPPTSECDLTHVHLRSPTPLFWVWPHRPVGSTVSWSWRQLSLEALQDIEFSLLVYKLWQWWVELCSCLLDFFWTVGWVLSLGLFSGFKVPAQVYYHGSWISMSLPVDSWKPKSGGLVVPLPQVVVWWAQVLSCFTFSASQNLLLACIPWRREKVKNFP